MTDVFLIRHAESTANAGAITHDPSSAPLTDKGWQQAREVAEQFTREPQLIVSSPFIRAKQTATPTMTRFYKSEHEIWPIQEFTYLAPTTCVGTTVEQRKSRVQAYWQQNDPSYIDGDDAESFSMMLLRVRTMLERLAEQSGLVAVFSHGQIIRAAQLILASPTASDQEIMRAFPKAAPIPNACIIPFSLP